MTLNPLPHIDPFMTVLLPAIAVIASSGTRFISAARSRCRSTYHRLRHPARDMMLVALAGPLTNFLLAVVFLARVQDVLVVEAGFAHDAASATLVLFHVVQLQRAAGGLQPGPAAAARRLARDGLLPAGDAARVATGASSASG